MLVLHSTRDQAEKRQHAAQVTRCQRRQRKLHCCCYMCATKCAAFCGFASLVGVLVCLLAMLHSTHMHALLACLLKQTRDRQRTWCLHRRASHSYRPWLPC